MRHYFMCRRYFDKKSKHPNKVDNKWLSKCRRGGSEKALQPETGVAWGGGAKVRSEEEGKRGSKKEQKQTAEESPEGPATLSEFGFNENRNVLRLRENLWPDCLEVLVSNFPEFKWFLVTEKIKPETACAWVYVMHILH